MTTFFEHQRTSFKKSYLKNLIALAASDGHLDDDEKALIYKIGMKRGLKEWQIQELLDDTTQYEIFLPETIANRMNMLFDLMQIIYADGVVTESEVEFISGIVAAFKLNPSLVNELIQIFKTGTPSSIEWNEFVDFVIHADAAKEMIL